MSVQMIARRYASALADVVTERGEAREVQEELNTWQQLIQSSANLQEVFRNPTIALDQKRAVLSKLIEKAKPRQTTVNFLKVLLQNQRLTELGEINRKFAEVLDVRAGMIAATVTTARTVPDSAEKAIRDVNLVNRKESAREFCYRCGTDRRHRNAHRLDGLR